MHLIKKFLTPSSAVTKELKKYNVKSTKTKPDQYGLYDEIVTWLTRENTSKGLVITNHKKILHHKVEGAGEENNSQQDLNTSQTAQPVEGINSRDTNWSLQLKKDYITDLVHLQLGSLSTPYFLEGSLNADGSINYNDTDHHKLGAYSSYIGTGVFSNRSQNYIDVVKQPNWKSRSDIEKTNIYDWSWDKTPNGTPYKRDDYGLQATNILGNSFTEGTPLSQVYPGWNSYSKFMSKMLTDNYPAKDKNGFNMNYSDIMNLVGLTPVYSSGVGDNFRPATQIHGNTLTSGYSGEAATAQARFFTNRAGYPIDENFNLDSSKSPYIPKNYEPQYYYNYPQDITINNNMWNHFWPTLNSIIGHETEHSLTLILKGALTKEDWAKKLDLIKLAYNGLYEFKSYDDNDPYDEAFAEHGQLLHNLYNRMQKQGKTLNDITSEDVADEMWKMSQNGTLGYLIPKSKLAILDILNLNGRMESVKNAQLHAMNLTLQNDLLNLYAKNGCKLHKIYI